MISKGPLSRAVRALTIAAVLGVLGTAAPRAAEEAVDADGRATAGALTLDDAGRLRFTPNGHAESAPLDSSASIRFPVVPLEPFRVGFVRRVLLPDGQQITGRLLSLDGDALTLRTAWADRVNVPRPALVALRQPPGRLAVFEDDFADGLQGWTVSGKPAVDGDPPVAALSEPGQSMAFAPAEPPEAGRVGVNFLDRDAAGPRWRADLRFQGAGEPRTLRVTLAGPGDAYEVEPPGADGDARRIARTPGWHRLTVRFSRDVLSVLCDDAVVWSNLRQGPGGTLRQVALACVEADKPVPPRGRVEVAEFSLARASDEPRRPPGDAGQDEVWLADGDQLFGDIPRIDRRAVDLPDGGGKRSLPWTEVRGCWFKHTDPPLRAKEVGLVRITLDSGLDPEPDVLEGVVKALDDKRLILQHPSLGELRIPRERLRRLRPLAPW